MKFSSVHYLTMGSIAIANVVVCTLKARDIERLEILNENYPRAFFFRASEGACVKKRYPTYESWEQQFNRLQGIMGKCLDEECLGREPRNPEFFSRFKKDHPTQAVLLHFNGNSRDPRYHTDNYFPGHWIYRQAIGIEQDIPAEPGKTVIHVEDTHTFRVNVGRYKTSNDDIALFGITRDGMNNWDYCEQVQLLEVDVRAKTITVKRGCYGTWPLAFRAGKSRAATHVVEGPWGRNNNLMWYYNLTTHCPRDANGNTCAELVTHDLAEWFGPQGKLAALDGLEFDVMHNHTRGDTNGDGVEDHGIIDGVNQYGIGIVEFARQLRERMGDNFIIQGDGALGPGGSRSQRAWDILNGIESEGWPNLNEWEFTDWSGGLNRHFFWRENARAPALNYVNHKWNESVPGKPGARVRPQVPFSRHRLVFAACQFFDAMTCYSFAPRNDPDGKFGIWDELHCGIEHKIGWLGKPKGPAVRRARQTPDLLVGTGQGAALAARISGPVTARATAKGVVVSAKDPESTDLRFSIRRVPTKGTELCLALEMLGDPMSGYPREMARFVQIGVSGGMIDLQAEKPSETGMKLRGAREEVPLDRNRGASLQDRPREIAGKRLRTYFVHPPYKGGTGYAYWVQEADIPDNSELRFSIGMGKLSPERSDGVCFQVQVAEASRGGSSATEKIFEATTNRHQWLPQTVSLAPFAGKRLRLKFIADCGLENNATTDHAHWGNVSIVRAGATEDNITKTVKQMTWVNDRAFTSGFYYREIHSDAVDVSVVVEGVDDIAIRSLAAYAHPDAIYRLFEGGIVLANPSHGPYTFDLNKLSPGRTYRRLRGMSTQDPEVNNGRPQTGAVTLGERDALFLVLVD